MYMTSGMSWHCGSKFRGGVVLSWGEAAGLCRMAERQLRPLKGSQAGFMPCRVQSYRQGPTLPPVTFSRFVLSYAGNICRPGKAFCRIKSRGLGMVSKAQQQRAKKAEREAEGAAWAEPKAGHYWNGSQWLPVEEALNGPESPVPALDAPRAERKALGKAYRAAEEQKLIRELQVRAENSVQAKKGRPPIPYDPAMGAEICQRLAKGQSLGSICELPHMPDISTVYGFMRKEPSFFQDYMRAREEQAHTLFDQCLDIADDASNDTVENKDGDTTVNTIAVTRAKLRIDTRLRMAAKLSPKVYSERSETLGIGAGNTVNVQVNAMTIDARTLDADQRDNLRRLLLEAKGTIIDV